MVDSADLAPPGPPILPLEESPPAAFLKQEKFQLKAKLEKTPRELDREIVEQGLNSKAFRKGPEKKRVISVVWKVATPLEKQDVEDETKYLKSGYASNSIYMLEETVNKMEAD